MPRCAVIQTTLPEPQDFSNCDMVVQEHMRYVTSSNKCLMIEHEVDFEIDCCLRSGTKKQMSALNILSLNALIQIRFRPLAISSTSRV